MNIRVKAISQLAEDVVYRLLEDIDPAEKRYPTDESTIPLRVELEQIIEGAIADWIDEKKERQHD